MIGQIVPFPPGTPTLGDVTIAVQDFQTGTTTGTFNHTTTAISGTPTGVLLMNCGQFVGGEPGGTNPASLAMTSLAGSSANHFRTASLNGGATTSGHRLHAGTSSEFRIYDSSAGLWVSGTAARISGGVSINYSTAAFNFRSFFVAFAGADVSAVTATASLGTGTSAITQTPSFSSDVVFFYGACTGTDNAAENFFSASFGIALKDGTQRCLLLGEPHAAADGAPLQALLTNRCGGQINVLDGSLSYGVTFGNVTSTTFDLTPSASTGGDRLFWHALKLTGRRTKLVDFSTPTTTGSHSVTGVGFTPQFAMVVLSSLEAVDPSFPVSTSALMSAMSICAVGDEQWSYSIRVQSGAATTSTQSHLKNTAVFLRGPSGTTVAVEAALTSFDSDGMTLNYSTVSANSKKGFILFVE